MKKIQAKLKDCAEKQSMSVESLERLSNALHTTTAEDTTAVEDAMMASSDQQQTSILSEEVPKEFKGENKAPSKYGNYTVNKQSKRGAKHKKNTKKTIPEKTEKKRPRFFVQF